MRKCEFDLMDGPVCGKPAVNHVEFEDKSILWLCAEHYDDWVIYIRRRAQSGLDYDAASFERIRKANDL